MEPTPFQRAERFIWTHARLLERQLFACFFRGGSREAALAALLAYRNSDGGFGNALEPDIRCPMSQPVPVQHALEMLDAIGFDDEIARRACDYLMTIATSEGGVPWILPSAHQYPRAPWWNAAEPLAAALNPTAAIAGLLHKHAVRHPWLELATTWCWQSIAAFQPAEMHDLGCVLTFLYHAPDRQRAEQELERIVPAMFAAGLVADVADTGYVRRPLDWSPTPDHPLRKFFDAAVIEANLDQLLAEQQEDGGWPIAWPAISPACEADWRGWVTLGALRTLQANGRLALS